LISCKNQYIVEKVASKIFDNFLRIQKGANLTGILLYYATAITPWA